MHHRSHNGGKSASRGLRGSASRGQSGGLYPGGESDSRGYASRRLLHQGGGQTPVGSAYREVLSPHPHHPPEIHGILQDTVNKWAVCILLECILAFFKKNIWRT